MDFLLPTVKVKRGDDYAIINESDLSPDDVVIKDGEPEKPATKDKKKAAE